MQKEVRECMAGAHDEFCRIPHCQCKTINHSNMKSKALSMVEEFHTAFNHPVLSEPGIPPTSRQLLRHSLIKEELEEFRQACINNNIVEVADALGDIAYVMYGAVLEFGLQDKFKEIFAAIHESNMSKSSSTKEEAEATIVGYEHGYVEERGGRWFAYNGQGKTIKSINYKPVNIHKILSKDGIN